MAPLLGRVAKRIHSYCTWRQCCECGEDGRGRDVRAQYVSKRMQRQREKRVTQKWLDEYESIHGFDGCPHDGLSCTCNKMPVECPHRSCGWSPGRYVGDSVQS